MHRRGRRPKLQSGKGGWRAGSPDGRIAFTLNACGTALYAEREHVEPSMGRQIQAVVFADESAFDRWCQADEARFAYPLVCDRVRRRGHEHFAQRVDIAIAA